MKFPSHTDDLPESVIRLYTKPEAADLAAQWLDVFGKNRRGMNTKDFLWHVFSGARYRSLSGAAALAEYDKQVDVGRLRSGRYSLVIASQREPVNGLPMAGVAWVVQTTSLLCTFSAATAERWIASNRLGVGPAQADSGFGSSFAIGDFNDDGASDLVIGVPNLDDGPDANAGGIQVLYRSGFIFRDGFQ